MTLRVVAEVDGYGVCGKGRGCVIGRTKSVDVHGEVLAVMMRRVNWS